MKRILAGLCGLAMTAAAMVALFPGASAAVSVCSTDGASCTSEYDSWGGVKVTDEHCDGDPAYSNYYRAQQPSYSQKLNNASGCHTTVASGSDTSNKVTKFRSCADEWFGDACSGYVAP